MQPRSLLFAAIFVLTACRVTDDRPIVDMQGVNVAQYNTDLAECRIYADEVRAGREAAQGAVGGAVVGGVIGAAIGNSDTVQRAAGAGAVAGAARGVGEAVREREMVVRNCLRGRGYRVLN
ncbi:MAG: hypothetical protein WD772_02765 [Pseudohongiellaceae bacterium]